MCGRGFESQWKTRIIYPENIFFLNTGNRTFYKAQYFLIAYELVDVLFVISDQFKTYGDFVCRHFPPGYLCKESFPKKTFVLAVPNPWAQCTAEILDGLIFVFEFFFKLGYKGSIASLWCVRIVTPLHQKLCFFLNRIL